MDALVRQVGAALDGAVPRAAPVVVAVSGGPDSTAMLHLVAMARPDLVLTVGHVRHGLRDDAADAACAAAHARALGVPCVARQVVVDPGHPGGLAAAARAVRYQALAEIAAGAGARVVLVGHTADDQAETILLNLGRGTGVRGLAGMAPVQPLGSGGVTSTSTGPTSSVTVVRPLLGVRRAVLHRWAAARGLAAIRDPGNADLARRRARVRAEVLPAMARLAGGEGDPVAVLTRLADHARQDADALDGLAAAAADDLVAAWGPARMVRRAALAALPDAVGSRVVRTLLAAVRGSVDGLSAGTVARVLALDPGGVLDAGAGVRVSVGGGWLAAAPRPAEATRSPAPLALPVPGSAPLPDLGLTFVAAAPGTADPTAATWVHQCAQAQRSTHVGVLVVPPWGGPAAATLPPGELTVRAWRRGDRMIGGRAVADALARAGVPRVVRPHVPCVCVDGQPVWAPGLTAAGEGAAQGSRVWVAVD